MYSSVLGTSGYGIKTGDSRSSSFTESASESLDGVTTTLYGSLVEGCVESCSRAVLRLSLDALGKDLTGNETALRGRDELWGNSSVCWAGSKRKRPGRGLLRASRSSSLAYGVASETELRSVLSTGLSVAASESS